MNHYQVDFDAEERVLHQMDFLESEHQRPNRLTNILYFPLINAGNFTVEEEVEETPDEQEPEPESEPEPVLTPEPDPEPDQDLKSEASEVTNPTPETPENNWGQEDGCGDIRKEAVCEKNSLSTSQVYIHLLVFPP